MKLCECGCKLPAPIAQRTNPRKGHIKGEPVRFIPGHNVRFQEIAERFWSQVDKTTTPTGCWEWTGHRNARGYGRIRINGRRRYAHHVALELAGYIIPFKGLQVRHYICDNPPCCRPSHLRIGTRQEDRDDMTGKGRQARGERVASAKLQQENVDEIRSLYAAGGISQRALAKRFGVSRKQISSIINGKAWAMSIPSC